MHSLLDHVHRLYPVELTEFVDDITHKVEGTGASSPAGFSSVGEMRALGLTVSLKSGMVASSLEFGRVVTACSFLHSRQGIERMGTRQGSER